MKTIEDIFENGTTAYCSPTHAAKMYADGNCPFSSVEMAIRDAMREYAREFLQSFMDFQREFRGREDPNGFGATDDYIYQEFLRRSTPSHKPAQ